MQCRDLAEPDITRTWSTGTYTPMEHSRGHVRRRRRDPGLGAHVGPAWRRVMQRPRVRLVPGRLLTAAVTPHDLHKISTGRLRSSHVARLMAPVLLRSSRCVPCVKSQWSSAMSERHQHAPRCVYLLADSLDSILAACEDLLASRGSDPCELFRLELAAITRVLQARRHIEQLDETEPALLDESALFLTATDSLDLAHLRRGRVLHPQMKSMAVS